jgi:GTP 3',8-cyclase
MLLDTFSRPLRNLRLSVTDRCNLRCEYCMPEEDYVWLPREDVLHFEEFSALVDVFISLGVDKVRLTGGEPLLRRDLATLVRLLAAKPGLNDLALTTNGVLLADHVDALKAAGLGRLTVSLDTLRADRFAALTRFNQLNAVLQGIEAARRVFGSTVTTEHTEGTEDTIRSTVITEHTEGTEDTVRPAVITEHTESTEDTVRSARTTEHTENTEDAVRSAVITEDTVRTERQLLSVNSVNSVVKNPPTPSSLLKLDTVVIRGVNDDELTDLVEFAKSMHAEVRFIEYMDVGGATHWSPDRVVSRAEMLDVLTRRYGTITPVVESSAKNSAAPAERFRLPDGTTFGIISSTTAPFCRTCDRSRLTADGMWYLCLYAVSGTDLRGPLRRGATPEELQHLIAGGWRARTDRGAEQRLQLGDRRTFVPMKELQKDPHLEMHTRGG